MPTIITHAIVPLAAGLALRPVGISTGVLVTGVILSMLPDADAIGFQYGINYADTLGHRGASHALVVAAGVALTLTACLFSAKPFLVFTFLFVAMASHGVLDAFTNGGLGPALFWPLDDARVFAPVTPIEVSPIGRAFFSQRGLDVLKSEVVWVWGPVILICLVLSLAFKVIRVSKPS